MLRLFFAQLLFLVLLIVNICDLTAQQSSDFVAVNESADSIKIAKPLKWHSSEETVDHFFLLPFYDHINMGALGQYSALSYLGANPRFNSLSINSVPFVSYSSGSWDYHSIPYSILNSVTSDGNIKFSTIKSFEDIPVSKIKYQVGERDWKHTDVMLSRMITPNLSFTGTGSSEHFIDDNLDYNIRQYRGASIFGDINYQWNSWKFRLNALYSEKSNPIVGDIADTIQKKTIPQSSKVRMASLNISHSGILRRLNTTLYYLGQKDFAESDSLLYGSMIFNNSEEQYGVGTKYDFLSDDIKKAELTVSANYTQGKGVIWNGNEGISEFSIDLTLEQNYKGSIVKYTPQINYNSLPGRKLRHNYENISFERQLNSRLSVKIDHKKMYAHPSVGDIYRDINGAQLDYDDNFSKYASLTQDDLTVKYQTENMRMQVDLFRASVHHEKRFDYFEGTNEFAFSVIQQPDFSYNGLSIQGGLEANSYFSAQFYYTFYAAPAEKLYSARNNLMARVRLNKMEDFITQKNINTGITVTAGYYDDRNAKVFLPFVQKFSNTNVSLPSLLYLKLRGDLTVRDLTLFYEFDLLSREEYQYVLGYPLRDRMIRFLGVEWKFLN